MLVRRVVIDGVRDRLRTCLQPQDNRDYSPWQRPLARLASTGWPRRQRCQTVSGLDFHFEFETDFVFGLWSVSQFTADRSHSESLSEFICTSASCAHYVDHPVGKIRLLDKKDLPVPC